MLAKGSAQCTIVFSHGSYCAILLCRLAVPSAWDFSAFERPDAFRAA
jgi:hypothetical protein